jgi:hypothetical protein
MKKLILTAMIATSLFACKNNSVENQTSTASTIPANVPGYIVDSSAHINAAKMIMDTFVNGNLAANKAKLLSMYADTAKVHDNKNTQTMADNIDTYVQIRNSGVKFSVIQTPIIWETVLTKPSANGVTSYVHAYYNFSIEKGGKKDTYTMNIVWDFVGDKVAAEWDLYDSAPIMAVIK